MDLGLSAVVVGAISTVGSLMVALIQRAHKRTDEVLKAVARDNREDHRILQHQVSALTRSINKVEDLLIGHIRWHGEQGGHIGTVGGDPFAPGEATDLGSGEEQPQRRGSRRTVRRAG
jgi:hypothetical protein